MRNITLSDNELDRHRAEFRRRFGRNPRPNDPLFWSERSGDKPVAMTEEEIEHIIWDAMERTGFDPTQVRFNKNWRLKPA